MLDRTNLAHMKHKLRLMRQENGETTQEYLKRYSVLENEIKKEEFRLAIVDETKQLQEEAIKIRKQQKIYDYIQVVSMVLLLAIGLSCCCFILLK